MKNSLIILIDSIIIAFCICCNSSTENNQPTRFCERSNFTDLNDAIQNKTCVKTLSLRGKNFKTIPKEVFEFENLEELDLSMNLFDSIPDDIKKLKNLTTLLVAYGNLEYISPEIQYLDKLRSINFLYNHISNFPSAFCALKSISGINLNGNPIYVVPECIAKVKTLKSLLIVEEIPKPKQYINELTRIKGLFSDKNSFEFENR